MTGTGWIRVIFAISGHFSFLVWSEKYLENGVLIFWAHNIKYKGEKTQIKNLAQNPPKNCKRFKPKAIPSFLGDVGRVQVVLEFLFIHPKCHFWARKDQHFWQKCPQKMALGVF